jgi:DNA repair protein RadC
MGNREASQSSIRDWPVCERPRERFHTLGSSALSIAELLAIILSSGSTGRTAIDIARDLISQFEGLRKIASADVEELRRVEGVGDIKAVKILAAMELGKRMIREKSGVRVRLGSPAEVYRYLGPSLQDMKVEVFKVLMVNTRNDLLGELTVARGGPSSSTVHPGEVFRQAILKSANGIIIAHNHPSGDPSPSSEDRELTVRLREAGNLLGIFVQDHVIVGDHRYISFLECGLMSQVLE